MPDQAGFCSVDVPGQFFYTGLLSQHDNLFRAVIEALALYNNSHLSKGEPKAPWLERLRTDGIYLVDLATIPINRLAPPVRRQARRASVEGCLRRMGELSRDGIVVCHKRTFELLARPMQAASMPLLRHVGIPFPLPNKRKEFVEMVRAAVAAPLPLPVDVDPPSTTTNTGPAQVSGPRNHNPGAAHLWAIDDPTYISEVGGSPIRFTYDRTPRD